MRRGQNVVRVTVHEVARSSASDRTETLDTSVRVKPRVTAIVNALSMREGCGVRIHVLAELNPRRDEIDTWSGATARRAQSGEKSFLTH